MPRDYRAELEAARQNEARLRHELKAAFEHAEACRLQMHDLQEDLESEGAARHRTELDGKQLRGQLIGVRAELDQVRAELDQVRAERDQVRAELSARSPVHWPAMWMGARSASWRAGCGALVDVGLTVVRERVTCDECRKYMERGEQLDLPGVMPALPQWLAVCQQLLDVLARPARLTNVGLIEEGVADWYDSTESQLAALQTAATAAAELGPMTTHALQHNGQGQWETLCGEEGNVSRDWDWVTCDDCIFEMHELEHDPPRQVVSKTLDVVGRID